MRNASPTSSAAPWPPRWQTISSSSRTIYIFCASSAPGKTAMSGRTLTGPQLHSMLPMPWHSSSGASLSSKSHTPSAANSARLSSGTSNVASTPKSSLRSIRALICVSSWQISSVIVSGAERPISPRISRIGLYSTSGASSSWRISSLNSSEAYARLRATIPHAPLNDRISAVLTSVDSSLFIAPASMVSITPISDSDTCPARAPIRSAAWSRCFSLPSPSERAADEMPGVRPSAVRASAASTRTAGSLSASA